MALRVLHNAVDESDEGMHRRGQSPWGLLRRGQSKEKDGLAHGRGGVAKDRKANESERTL